MVREVGVIITVIAGEGGEVMKISVQKGIGKNEKSS